MAISGGPVLYEVVCPRCSHVSEVDEDAVSMRCASCALESDLVSESQAEALRIDPVRGVLPEGVSRWDDAPGDEALEEIPCPACAAPILVAPDEADGYCPHCAAELEFEHVDEADEAETPAGPSGPTDAEGRDEAEMRAAHDAAVQAAREAELESERDESPPSMQAAPDTPAPAPAFDPELVITSDNAPIVECTTVKPMATPETALAATVAAPETTTQPVEDDASADEGPVPDEEAVATDGPAEDEPSPEVPEEAARPGAFDPTLGITPDNAPVVSCRASEATGDPIDPTGPSTPDDPPGTGGEGPVSTTGRAGGTAVAGEGPADADDGAEEVAWVDVDESDDVPSDARVGSTQPGPARAHAADEETMEEIPLEVASVTDES